MKKLKEKLKNLKTKNENLKNEKFKTFMAFSELVNSHKFNIIFSPDIYDYLMGYYGNNKEYTELFNSLHPWGEIIDYFQTLKFGINQPYVIIKRNRWYRTLFGGEYFLYNVTTEEEFKEYKTSSFISRLIR